ncbi:hypothetical protein [Chryseobacterium lathyri]|uniref:Uncharacterized protein n=1 Tax=Chryseobacterium lathyri TaxID=395933 RepID=A0A511Y8P4_9FLAO|nr:hypothetical protein [Chryseobacterium lathyri]GEN71568.1 hypothetical protein CLA01_16400 [Chryseobacterium lathyri]
MPITPLNTILSWYETGDYPTQEQFAASWSSFWHKDDLIPIDKVENLSAKLQDKTDKLVYNAHLTDQDAHNSTLAKLDGSNLNDVNIQAWKNILGVGALPANMATVDDPANTIYGNVWKKEQSDALYMIADHFVSNGKIMASAIEALGLTTILKDPMPVESTIAQFAVNSANYEFQDNDIIPIPSGGGNYTLYIFIGGNKSQTLNYLSMGLSNITIAMVQGLQAALDAKMNKPVGNGNFFINQTGTVTTYKNINPAANYLLFWNSTDFTVSGIYHNSGKYGAGTTSPSEMLHLFNGRLRTKAVVLDDNSEQLPGQITYAGRRFAGTDDTGVSRNFMYRDYTDMLGLFSSFTQSQLNEWKTVANGGWTTGTMSVAVILPPIVDKQDRDYYITLKGANLNLNPTSFSVEIMNSAGTTVIATVPNSQVQLYQNGVDLVFYYNFKNLPLGNYKIRLWNGVAFYVTNPTINLIDLLTPVSLSGLSWNMLNNATICPTVDITTASGTSIHRARNTNEQFVGSNQDAISYKSSVLIPSAIADGDFYLELTNTTAGVIYYDGNYGYDYGLVDAAQPLSHSMQILAGIRRNFFFDERILPDNIVVNGSNINTATGLNRTSKLYITKKGNIVSISSVNNGQLTTVVSTWFQPNGVDLAFFVNFNSYNNSNNNNGANIQTDIYVNSLIQL